MSFCGLLPHFSGQGPSKSGQGLLAPGGPCPSEPPVWPKCGQGPTPEIRPCPPRCCFRPVRAGNRGFFCRRCVFRPVRAGNQAFFCLRCVFREVRAGNRGFFCRRWWNGWLLAGGDPAGREFCWEGGVFCWEAGGFWESGVSQGEERAPLGGGVFFCERGVFRYYKRLSSASCLRRLGQLVKGMAWMPMVWAAAIFAGLSSMKMQSAGCSE